jgi:hypothetical protein
MKLFREHSWGPFILFLMAKPGGCFLPMSNGSDFRYSLIQTKNLTNNTMNKLPNFSLSATRLALALAAGLVASTISSQAQSAMATISEVPGTGGNFDYTISLENTGTQSLNSFWYGWTVGVFNLAPGTTSVASSSLGWTATIDGNSIMWQNTASSPALAEGQSETFTFDSTASLSTITTPPSGQSVAFTSDDVQFNEGVAGQSTPVFSPAVAAVPEPSSMGLMAAGLLGLVGVCRRTVRRA